jgi:hypothetical protein
VESRGCPVTPLCALSNDTQIVEAIIKRHGPVHRNPGVIIDIIRRSSDDDPDGGDRPCGGVPLRPL